MLAMFFGESTGRELLECAIEITERTDDPFWTAYLAGGMTLFHQYADRHDLAKQPLERLHTVAFRLRNPLLEIFCCGRGAYLALAFGDLAGAATLIDDALRTEIANECLNFSFHAMHAAAELELCRGRPAEAHSALEELWRRFVRQGVHQFLPLVANSSARSLIAQGQGTTARRVLAAPWAHPSVQASTPHRIWLRDTLARAAWLEGDIATARAEAVRQCAEAADFGNVAMIGSAQMLLGAIARANDSPVRAAKAFRAALDAFVLLGFCPDAADALDELAGLHSDAGRAQRAVVLHTAAGVIRPHGCAPRFDRVVLYETDRAAARASLGATELARSEALGASLTLASAVRYAPSPVAARSACGWASLSTSERGVAELASAGLTNRSIAEQLGVTSETVKTQLSSVYRKVGVANRTQLAASWAASVRDDN
jgi:ATP/maltotriose-dependent transcriptional regulator MalT